MEAMSRYPRHPYQSTTLSSNPSAQLASYHSSSAGSAGAGATQPQHYAHGNNHAHNRAPHNHHHHHQNNNHQQQHHHHQQQQLSSYQPLMRPELGQQQANHHQPLRNPWISAGGDSLSTNSSSSSRTYRGGGAPPSALWQQAPDFPSAPPLQLAHYQDQHHTVEVMVDGPGRNTLLLHPPSAAAPTIKRYSTSSRGGCSERDRPSTPASSPGGQSGGGRATVDGCGGHCVAFETFCYYCLQVIFIAGILVGVSLIIAGSVLRSQQRGGDLLVLVYIGCLMAMVCTLLLSVQCCVRRNVKRRKRSLRQQRDRVGQRRVLQQAHQAGMEIPMQDMSTLKSLQGPPLSRSDLALQHQQQYQPLLMHIVQQQQTCNATVAFDSMPRPQAHHPNNYRSGNTTDTSGFVGRMMDVSRSGTPWWRRDSDQHTVAESRH